MGDVAADADYDLSIREAAEYLDVHAHTLKRWVAKGKVAAVKTPGGWYRFRRADLDRALTPVEPDGSAA